MKNLQHIVNSLPVFVEAARLGSFTKAGEKLGMAQPSVSRFIHNLETGTGLVLFHRNYNRIELTKNGKMLFDAVNMGLDHINRTLSHLHEMDENHTVTIGCSHGFSHMWLQARLPEIQKNLPNQKVRIVTTDHTVSLTHEDVSCAVRLGNGQWPECETKLLFSERVFPVCSPEFAQKHNLMGKADLAPEKLIGLPLLVLDEGKYGWLGWQEWFAYHHMQYEEKPGAEPINNYAFTLQAAMAGQGIALMWCGLDRPYLARNWLVELGRLRVETGNAYYLTFPQNSPLAARISNAFE